MSKTDVSVSCGSELRDALLLQDVKPPQQQPLRPVAAATRQMVLALVAQRLAQQMGAR